jgi:hypothetical protein
MCVDRVKERAVTDCSRPVSLRRIVNRPDGFDPATASGVANWGKRENLELGGMKGEHSGSPVA